MNIRGAIERVLKDDVMVQAIVDRDSRNQPKVYESVALKDVQAPFVVWFLIPGEQPSGLYHDLRAIEVFNFQVTAWGRDREEAWNLADEVMTALEVGTWDPELTPYSLMDLVHRGDGTPLDDPDTSWVQVPRTYRLRASR